MTGRFPEDLLVAVFHLVGSDTRLVDDVRLANAFDEASRGGSSLFTRFRKHPQYQYCRMLSEALQTLALGGSITHETTALQYFHVSKHVAGAYGRVKVEGLLEDEQAQVRSVAAAIRFAFGVRQEHQQQGAS